MLPIRLALMGPSSKAQGLSPGSEADCETSPEGAMQQSPGPEPWERGRLGNEP